MDFAERKILVHGADISYRLSGHINLLHAALHYQNLLRALHGAQADKLRNKPRISPAGNVMRKLSKPKKMHLEADQIAQEGSEIHSVDYDVWIDEKTGYKQVEKYYSYQHAIECPECGYVTMKIHHEEVNPATVTRRGRLACKHYRCSFCAHKMRKEVHLAKLADNIA